MIPWSAILSRAERLLPSAARANMQEIARRLPEWPRSPWAYFDVAYYLDRYPDLRRGWWEPHAHYLRHGARELRNPSALFDAGYYASRNPAAAENPLLHYLIHGVVARLDPHPLFDTAYYLKQRPNAAQAINPLWDFMVEGAALGVSPHPLFDAVFYMGRYGHLDGVRANPLAHYICHGSTGRFWPNAFFDPQTYRSYYALQMSADMEPLVHFQKQPNGEGLEPCALFDSKFYVMRYPEAAEGCALAHYLQHQRENDPNPFFDTRYYIKSNADIDFTHIGPLEHFIGVGAREQRNPSSYFDIARYDAANSSATRGMNSLEHFILYGNRAAHDACLAARRLPTAALSKRPRARNRVQTATPSSDQAWATFTRCSDVVDARVNIIVPVYRGHDETLCSLYSVLESAQYNETPFSLVVINDASPDAQLTARLRKLGALGVFKLLENDSNLGFVQSVNRGMKVSGRRDVILLNADTQVYSNWVDRLCAVREKHPKAGTVTPLSNNATICSYPVVGAPCELALEIDNTTLDVLASRVNASEVIPIPTAVGFCMWISRACIDEVGLFDADTFGRGYGEENDFSMRAQAHGWQNLLTTNTFVYHRGGVSFANEYIQRRDAIARTLAKKHPQYDGLVSAFSAKDPVRPARRNLDLARLQQVIGDERPVVLLVTHCRGGGTEKHVQDMAEWLDSEGIATVVLRPEGVRSDTVRIDSRHVLHAANLTFDLAREGLQPLIETLRSLRVSFVHIHHTVDFNQNGPDFLRTLAQALNTPFDVTLHDYHAVCPQITLVDDTDRYCGEPDEAGCHACVEAKTPEGGPVVLWHWRAQHKRLLRAARHVYTPSDDAAKRFKRHWPQIEYITRPHADAIVERSSGRRPRRPDESLRVAVIGAIGYHKGVKLLHRCAQDALNRGLNIQFRIVGYSIVPGLYTLSNVTTTHGYNDNELMRLLEAQACHLALFLSVWPETFSYTLSAAFAAQLYPVAFDLGAPADRIRDAAWGSLMPIDWMRDAAKINDYLLSLKIAPAPKRSLLRGRSILYPGGVSEYYGWKDPVTALARG